MRAAAGAVAASVAAVALLVLLDEMIVKVTGLGGEAVRGRGAVDQDQRPPGCAKPSAQDTGTAAGDDELAVQFSELARKLQQSNDPHATLAEVVRAAVELIPGAGEASICVVLGRRRVSFEAPSGELARAVDAVQDELGQGPCLHAVYEQQTVRVADLASETRWPQFTQRARQAGAAGMLSFQLYVQGDNLGALNLYSRRPRTFDDESEHVGLLFASHAALAYAAVQQQAGLTRSVATRTLIGQAQGILMERHKLPADRAFALLVRISQHRNIKLRDVADALVNTGALPEGK